ncbi:FGGY-family carbohydrate kinase [Zhihengliuella salsuginis]|uniref:Sugar kinase n=1 Tax=Zhihengliuella salsuginis TaxID=578222 RepID=A0ABQ3GBN1_9MICC|nr:FGGY-family carbohydrate kinase [Zhihengliuella salsuginis]GHC99823.1 sugar kinase [Zhihengliuella salsuginis]
MDERSAVLGLDIGTGSTKAVLTDARGGILATSVRHHSMSMPHSAWAEMDAESDWWGDAVVCLRELAAAAADLGRTIAAVCVSGLGPAVVAESPGGAVRSPAILYGVDTRSGEQIDQLNRELGRPEILGRGGTELSSQAAGAKLLWLAQHGALQPGDRFFSSHTFVTWRLTGAYYLDHQTASQFDPFYDMAAGRWAEDWAGHYLPGRELPPLRWPGEIVGAVTAAAAAQTGLGAGTPVLAGTIDAWAEAYSVGTTSPGDAMLMYGSTVLMISALEGFRSHPGLWATTGLTPGSHTLAAGMSTSGSLMSWIRDLCSGQSYESLIEQARAVPPGADGLLMLPYFAGERAPVSDPKARGVIAGLTLGHGPGHLFRAGYESIAFGVRQILDLLRAADAAPTRVVAVGGGTQGGLGLQVVSDVCGIEQHVPRTVIGASYGDALLAAQAAGLADPSAGWCDIARTITPDPEHRAAYDELYPNYSRLYAATRSIVHDLADFGDARGT